jgi:hypothetical protein
LLTVQEIGGHFLFGFVVGIPLRNLKASILIGLMALTIDSDHLLNIAGFHIQGRIDHSIPFAMLSSVLMGFIANKFYFKISRENAIIIGVPSSRLKRYKKKSEEAKQNIDITSILSAIRNNNNKKSSFYIFIFFSFITLSAFVSHIAYDVFVDDEAKFPLLAPFSFSEIVIPRSYGLPIELAGLLLVALLVYLHYRVGTHRKAHADFRNEQEN